MAHLGRVDDADGNAIMSYIRNPITISSKDELCALRARTFDLVSASPHARAIGDVSVPLQRSGKGTFEVGPIVPYLDPILDILVDGQSIQSSAATCPLVYLTNGGTAERIPLPFFGGTAFMSKLAVVASTCHSITVIGCLSPFTIEVPVLVSYKGVRYEVTRERTVKRV